MPFFVGADGAAFMLQCCGLASGADAVCLSTCSIVPYVRAMAAAVA